MSIPFSAAADRNKEVIGDVLETHLSHVQTVLEIGSGTGQHAVYFAGRFSGVVWQPTDRAENITAISARVNESGLKNVLLPLVLDVEAQADLVGRYDFAFSANTAHIMSVAQVRCMFNVVSTHLKVNAVFALYGPFKYRGQHTAQSNESFDAMLQQQGAHMGIRDKADLDAMAFDVGLDFYKDIEMPANNRLLMWRR